MVKYHFGNNCNEATLHLLFSLKDGGNWEEGNEEGGKGVTGSFRTSVTGSRRGAARATGSQGPLCPAHSSAVCVGEAAFPDGPPLVLISEAPDGVPDPENMFSDLGVLACRRCYRPSVSVALPLQSPTASSPGVDYFLRRFPHVE